MSERMRALQYPAKSFAQQVLECELKSGHDMDKCEAYGFSALPKQDDFGAWNLPSA